MELPQHGFMEELLALRREAWNPFPEFFTNGWNFDSFDECPSLGTPDPSFTGLSGQAEELLFDSSFAEPVYPLVDGLGEIDRPLPPPNADADPPAFPIPGSYSPAVKDEEIGDLCCFGGTTGAGRIEYAAGSVSGERRSMVKRPEGQPSKNLMAERRRRKRLNDRLSMLRSIVPKISKMDRTSILGDTIDYMRELLERIGKLQGVGEGETEMGRGDVGVLRELKKTNEPVVRNSPKFDVKRREGDTRIEICCAARPGLLLSTVQTLEALGLEIQQCVISCFNDFSMQASCSEEAVLSAEEIKQALFRTAGYGGKCMP